MRHSCLVSFYVKLQLLDVSHMNQLAFLHRIWMKSTPTELWFVFVILLDPKAHTKTGKWLEGVYIKHDEKPGGGGGLGIRPVASPVRRGDQVVVRPGSWSRSRSITGEVKEKRCDIKQKIWDALVGTSANRETLYHAQQQNNLAASRVETSVFKMALIAPNVLQVCGR